MATMTPDQVARKIRNHRHRYPDCQLDPLTHDHRSKQPAVVFVEAPDGLPPLPPWLESLRDMPPPPLSSRLTPGEREAILVTRGILLDPLTTPATRSVTAPRYVRMLEDMPPEIDAEECDCPAALRERVLRARGWEAAAADDGEEPRA